MHYVQSFIVHQGQTKEKGETKKRKNGSSTVCEPQTDERRNTFKLNCVRDDEIVSSHSSHMSSL